jgi:lanosterol synthase
VLIRTQELYTQNYYSIDWPAQRDNICPADNYSPHTKLFDFLNVILGAYELCTLPPARRIALAKAYELVVYEDDDTNFQALAPVNKMMNLVCRAHVEGPESFAYKMHKKRRQDFMWLGAEGMMCCGTNGSQLWDLTFITQALVETGLAEDSENRDSLQKALKWLDGGQIRNNPKWCKESRRQPTKGAWGFSTKEQGYTVSDCTGEGLKAVLYLQQMLK